MLHVKQIREIVETGRYEEAHEALDQLLSLGPQNTEALKLKARLYEYEGRFVEEGRIWEKIATIDNEDQDAIGFLLRRQLEDREHFYFTDDLPGGGRRFMAYPRGLVNVSAIGLAGCLGFLLTTRLTEQFPILADARVMLGIFAILVVAPWIGIIVAYFRALTSVSVTGQGFTVATRLKMWGYTWPEIDKCYLARTLKDGHPRLSLVLIPKDPSRKILELNLNHGTTAIRARSYLIREISRAFGEPLYARREELALDEHKLLTF